MLCNAIARVERPGGSHEGVGRKKVGSQSTNSSKPEWYKVLPKPSTFEPKDREAELSGFRDWWWQVEQYIVAVDSSYGQDLLYICSHLDEKMSLVEQDSEENET